MPRYGLLSLAAVLALVLSGCAGAPSHQAFLDEFAPDGQRLLRFEAIRHVPYTPRIREHGLKAINDAVNAVPYVGDGAGDRWDAPQRFWTHGGDCEEYALTKGLELLGQGYGPVYLVAVRDNALGIDHAVVAVEDRGMRVLDNQRPDILSWDVVRRSYRPYFAINLDTGALYRARPPERP